MRYIGGGIDSAGCPQWSRLVQTDPNKNKSLLQRFWQSMEGSKVYQSASGKPLVTSATKGKPTAQRTTAEAPAADADGKTRKEKKAAKQKKGKEQDKTSKTKKRGSIATENLAFSNNRPRCIGDMVAALRFALQAHALKRHGLLVLTAESIGVGGLWPVPL